MSGHEWHASTDPEDKTGTATFCMCGHIVVMRLEAFSDFDRMCRLLDAVYQSGMKDGARVVTYAAQDAYNGVKGKP